MIKTLAHEALLDGIPLDLFSNTEYFVIEESWRTKIRRDFFGIESIVTDFESIWQKEKIIKCGTVISSNEEERKFNNYIGKFKGRLNYTRTWTPAWPELGFVNITTLGVSKGKAMEALAFHLNIRTDEVMAIGDGSNDITLLSTAGLGVAMQNAPDELKTVADHITADVEQNGVALAIQKFLL